MSQEATIVVPFFIGDGGALQADVQIDWKLPWNFHPRHISAGASNDSDATLKVGVSDDDDAILEETTIGDSGDPSEFGPSDFADADYVVDKGDILRLTLGYDGDAGTAANDVTIVITGTVGA